MQLSPPPSRFSLLKSGKFKSLHRRRSSRDSAKSQVRSDSQMTNRTDDSTEYPTDDTPHSRPESRQQGRQYGTQEAPRSNPPISPRGDFGDNPRRIEAPAVPIAEQTSSAVTRGSPENVRIVDVNCEKEAVLAQDAEEEDEPRISEETMKESRGDVKPFHGLSDYTLDLGRSNGLIDAEFMKDTFGITMSRPDSADELSVAQDQEERGTGKDERMDKEVDFANVPPMPSSLEGGLHLFDDLFEMEVPLQLDGSPRRELETMTSPRRRTSLAEPWSGERSEESESTTSSAPTLRPINVSQKLAGPVAAVSLLSPVSAVESPKPRRPFSTASIERLQGPLSKAPRPDPAAKSANSMSSDEVSRHDEKSSEHSIRSSMSSVASQDAAHKNQDIQGPLHVDAAMERFDATSLYHAALSPKPPKSASSLRWSPQRLLIERQDSENSTQSDCSSTGNVNKPLPPEPGHKSNKGPDDEGLSRSSSATIRQHAQSRRGKAGGELVSPGSLKATNVGFANSRGSISGLSLRSKYTPKDLDVLDEAFLPRKAPLGGQGSMFHSYLSTPSSSQTSLTAEVPISLSTIREDIQRELRSASVPTDPAIPDSRNYARAEQSKRPTQTSHPISRLNSAASRGMNTNKGTAKQRSQPSAHIGSQIKELSTSQVHHSATTVVGGSRSKLSRLLGNTILPPIASTSRMDVQWPRNESLQLDRRKLDRGEGEDEHESWFPDEDASPDSHFEEIRERLELLRPKDDPSVTFLAYHQAQATRSSECLDHFDSTKLGSAVAIPDDELDEELELEGMGLEEFFATDENFLAEVPGMAELAGSHSPALVSEADDQADPEPIELEGSEPVPLAELPLPRSSISIPRKPVTAPMLAPAGAIRRSDSQVTKSRQSDIQRSASQQSASRRSLSQKSVEIGRRGSSAKSSSIQSLKIAKSKSVQSQRSTKVRSLASLAASEIPDMYAALPSTTVSSTRPSLHADGVEHLISPQAAEHVLLKILESLESFYDLFAAARVNRGFYRTFKRHELPLLKSALLKSSPAAWELREMSIPVSDTGSAPNGYTPKSYVSSYEQDVMIMVELKALMLDNCKSFLRSETIFGLAGHTNKSVDIENAFWRIWSFCRIFGCDSNREEDIVGQMDWLKGGIIAKQSMDRKTATLSDDLVQNSVLFNPPPGFARGNGDGLTADDIYDMTELWTCLGVLVQGYQGKREEAREFGIFDNVNVPAGDREAENAMLEEWTLWLLTLAPPTVLDVTSPATPTKTTFAHVQSQGYTLWPSPIDGSSRSTFLKEALCRVYEERIIGMHPERTTSPRSFSDLPQAVTPPPESSSSNKYEARQRIKEHAKELKAKKEDPSYKTVPLSPDRPMSNFQDVLARLESLGNAASRRVTANKLPTGLITRFSQRKPNKERLTSDSRISVNSTSKASINSCSTKPGPKNSNAECRTAQDVADGAEETASKRPELRVESKQEHRVLSPLVPSSKDPFPKRDVKATDEPEYKASFPKLDTIGKPSIGPRVDSLLSKQEQDHKSPSPAPSPVVNTGPKGAEKSLSSSNPGERKKKGFLAAARRFKSDRGKPGRGPDQRPQKRSPQGSQQSLPVEPTHSRQHSIDQIARRNSLDDSSRAQKLQDPVDLAVEKLVSLGFDEVKAKRALAETNKGDSIDFAGALALLARQRRTKLQLQKFDRMG